MPLPLYLLFMLKMMEHVWAPYGTFTVETHPDYVATVWQPNRGGRR